jgi:hypothetical protein
MDLVEALRWQARACADHGSPMYAELLARAAEDVAAGGPVAQVLASADSPADAADPVARMVSLRLLGSVHRLVLERRAEDLAVYYPSVGGTWEADGGWRAFRRLLAERPAEVAEWLDRPPQTNEVGRAAALYGGLLHVPRDLPVRLVEIGASGGLNLRADRFAYSDEAGRVFGEASSPVRLAHAWDGRPLEPWPELEVVARLGCDTRPVDVTTTEGRLVLTAYVWADMRARLDRLRRAYDVAARVPVEVRAQDAVAFLADLELAEGTTTVLWHSVMWQYLPGQAQQALTGRIEELGATATRSRRLAQVTMEPARRHPEPEFPVALRTWPGGEQRLLGRSVPHGVPTTWT